MLLLLFLIRFIVPEFKESMKAKVKIKPPITCIFISLVTFVFTIPVAFIFIISVQIIVFQYLKLILMMITFQIDAENALFPYIMAT